MRARFCVLTAVFFLSLTMLSVSIFAADVADSRPELPAPPPAPAREGDALAEVNAVRRAAGLPPFQRDRNLSAAAISAARWRAFRCVAGHTPNDFAFVPASTMALVPRGPGGWLQISGGCGASTSGWGSCCTFERWRYAGAAWCRGRDGRRYMHLFVR